MKSRSVLKMYLVLSLLSFSFQNKKLIDKSRPASAYSGDVINKWMALQIRLMASTPHRPNGPFVRTYSYSGVAAFYAVAPGIPSSSAYRISAGKLSNIPDLPEAGNGEKFYWPSSLNAALASMNRLMFPATTVENKNAIDSLETALRFAFAREANTDILQRSAQYGLQVAQAIFAWAESDGFHRASNKFTVPAGKGKWVPTPPEYDNPVIPNWGNLRTMVAGNLENAQPPAPLPYSEESTSAFYQQAKEVFAISRSPTPEQKNIALFWKELNPGITAPGHLLNVLRQLIEKENLTLDKAAFTYALTGISMNDAWIGSWKTRYQHNLLRPVTYIREVMGHEDWLSLLTTPPNPEYTAMFAVMTSAVCTTLEEVFGDNYTFTDHTYDAAGLGPRTYHSFRAMAKEAGESKIFGGIHYRFSVEAGLQQGRAVANNTLKVLLKKVGK